MKQIPEICKTINIRIGKNIRFRRKMIGMTQKALADRMGMSFQGIQKWECGHHNISAARLLMLAQALETPVTTLIPQTLPTMDSQTCPPSPPSNRQSRP